MHYLLARTLLLELEQTVQVLASEHDVHLMLHYLQIVSV